MQLHALSLEDAMKHDPQVPTYVMRIHSSRFSYEPFPLVGSSNYIRVVNYIFDDNSGGFTAGPVWIDDALAREMIDDFRCYHDSVDSFMTHCSQGKNRSPAVAIAFNEIFNFGVSRAELSKKHGDPMDGFNRHTCATLLRASGWEDERIKNFIAEMRNDEAYR